MSAPYYQNQTRAIIGVPTKAGISIQVPPGKYVFGDYYSNVHSLVSVPSATPAAADLVYTYPSGPEPYFVRGSVPVDHTTPGKKDECVVVPNATNYDVYVKVPTADGWVAATTTPIDSF